MMYLAYGCPIVNISFICTPLRFYPTSRNAFIFTYLFL